MNPKRKKRLLLVLFLVTGIGIAVTLGITAFRENLLFYIDASQVVNGEAPVERMFRLGGMVEKNSVKRIEGTLKVEFKVTDFANSVLVEYEGILPDLFSEGTGVITKGKLVNGKFIASEVLAKHDENYMPPEVAQSMKNKLENIDPAENKP